MARGWSSYVITAPAHQRVGTDPDAILSLGLATLSASSILLQVPAIRFASTPLKHFVINAKHPESGWPIKVDPNLYFFGMFCAMATKPSTAASS
jgi:hypothetical protein